MKHDNQRALQLIMKMLAIPGKSGEEAAIVEFIRKQLRSAGVPASAIRTDNAHKKSRYGGQVGNLIVKLSGKGKESRDPRRMLSAHVDTVPICDGCKPVKRGGWIHSADPNTGLGADNRSGAAAILTALLEIKRQKLDHPPLTLLFPIQEEVGLVGASHVSVTMLGNPKLAFNFDGGSPEKLTIGATGAYRMTINIQGIASHAGVAPQIGVSAITIAGMAIATLQRGGWLGAIKKKQGQGTSNIGLIEGGAATNVVTHQVMLKAEVRSHSKTFRKMILRRFISAFEKAAKSVRNSDGKCGKVTIKHHLDYESFKLRPNDACVVEAERAVRAAGGSPLQSVCDGGLDPNYLSQKGIPTVTMGAGQKNAHMTSEKLHIASFHMACDIALCLATAGKH
jgi:tripeptide aminopeptidase